MEIPNRKTINNIYSEYFDIIDSYFEAIKHHLGDEEYSHINLGYYISKYPLISDLILDSLDDLYENIYEFWEENAKHLFDFIKSQSTLKCVYSGDITPVSLESFVKKSALYVDSIIIPDPIFNLTLYNKQIVFDNKFYLNKIVRHIFNIWKLKDLLITDAKDNIIFILPINIQLLSQQDQDNLLNNANSNYTRYINTLINQEFLDIQNLFNFIEGIRTTEDLINNVKNPKLLPREFREPIALNNFLKDFSSINKDPKYAHKSIGWGFATYVQSQFIRVQEHKTFCGKLLAEPIYDYELPWFFFNYDIGCSGIDEAIINSLQKEKFEWISKVPIHALKVLRENNKLEYMRSILRNGITDLKSKRDSELLEVSRQIEANFKEAFKKQKSEIKSLEKEVANIIKKEIPITTGGFLLGFLPTPFNTVVSIFTTFRDMKNNILKLRKKRTDISIKKNDFINLLMNSYDD